MIQKTTRALFLLTFTLVVISGFFVFPYAQDAEAIIVDGIEIPNNMPYSYSGNSGSMGNIYSGNTYYSLAQQIGEDATSELFTTAGTNQVLELAQNVGVSNVASAVQQSSGSLLGQSLNLSGVQNITSVINQTTGTSFGQILNQSGPATINTILNQTGGQAFGSILNTAGSANLGGAIGSLGSYSGNINNIAGSGNAGAFMLSLSNGSLGRSVNQYGGGNFSNFVTNVGQTSAAGTIRNSITESIQTFSGSPMVSGASTPELPTITGGLEQLGIGSDSGTLPGVGERCNAGTGGFTTTGQSGFGTWGSSGISSFSPFSLGSGSYVPVKDSDQIELQENILEETTGIHEDTTNIREDTAAIRAYLKDLCEKEFSLDPEAQNQWVQVAENLVGYAVNFINTAYNDNPLYVENLYRYFDLVEKNVVETFITEINLSDGLDANVKMALRQAITRAFPDNREWQFIIESTTNGSDGETNFWNNERLKFIDPQNNQNIYAPAITELGRRLVEARSYEEQKLAWGQGFLSYEECANEYFETGGIYSFDLRNCDILTPGSIIKDHVSLVLGTALRQIEQADEYNEKIAAGAFAAINSVFNSRGLRGLTRDMVTGGPVPPESQSLTPTNPEIGNPFIPPIFGENYP